MRALAEGMGLLLMAGGAFFCLAAAIGLWRFPDVHARLHAGTKALTGGALLILLGGLPFAGSWAGMVRLGLIGLFLLATNPAGTHALARAIRIDEARTLADRLASLAPPTAGEGDSLEPIEPGQPPAPVSANLPERQS